MRVSAGSTLVDLAPGSSTDVDVDVVNTGSLIDGVTARVIGLPEQQVTTHPPVLALFPESVGRLTLSLELPSAYPAGRHPLTVEVFSAKDGKRIDRARGTAEVVFSRGDDGTVQFTTKGEVGESAGFETSTKLQAGPDDVWRSVPLPG